MNLGNKLTVFQTTACEFLYLSLLITQVGGIYFINHKTKDYFPEDAGLLNQSVSTLME